MTYWSILWYWYMSRQSILQYLIKYVFMCFSVKLSFKVFCLVVKQFLLFIKLAYIKKKIIYRLSDQCLWMLKPYNIYFYLGYVTLFLHNFIHVRLSFVYFIFYIFILLLMWVGFNQPPLKKRKKLHKRNVFNFFLVVI